MNFRLVAGCVAVVTFGACDCGKVGVPDDKTPDAAVVEDGGLFVPDAGAAVVQGLMVDVQGDLFVISLDGGARQLLSHDAGVEGFARGPRWQPGGSNVAFADGQRAYVLANGTLTRIEMSQEREASYQGDTVRVEWSPDGTRLAIDGREYTSDERAVFLVPGDGGAPELAGIGESWAWAGNGALLFSRVQLGVETIHRFEVDTQQVTDVREGRLLDVASNGLVFFQQPAALDDGGTRFDVTVLSPDGGTRPLVSGEGPAAYDPRDGLVVSPYSEEYALRGSIPRDLTIDVFVKRAPFVGAGQVPFDSTTPLADFPNCLRFVPGGELLSYLAENPGLFVIGRDGTKTKLATPTPSLAAVLGCVDWRVGRE